MKKILYSAALLILLVSVNNEAFAEESLPILGEAQIDIKTEDDHYVVKEYIELIDIQQDTIQIEHTLSKITNNQVSEVTFSQEDKEVSPTINAGDLLDWYVLQLDRSEQGTAAYTIEYTVPRTDNNFDVPLFVPEFAGENEKREVLVSFKAPVDTEIQKNSFPNITEGGQNYTEKHMANIPAKIAYVFSEKTIFLHSYNIVSFIAIFALLILLVSWGMVEIKKSKGSAS